MSCRNPSCGTCRPTGRCCTGPTGPGGSSGFGQLGLLEIDLGVSPAATYTVTSGQLVNASHPSLTYKAIRFVGGDDDNPVRVVLPAPSVNDDAYNIEIENSSLSELTISNNAVTGAAFLLDPFQSTEISLEDEIDSRINAGTATTYRTQVLVTTEGAWRVPGFTGAPG